MRLGAGGLTVLTLPVGIGTALSSHKVYPGTFCAVGAAVLIIACDIPVFRGWFANEAKV